MKPTPNERRPFTPLRPTSPGASSPGTVRLDLFRLDPAAAIRDLGSARCAIVAGRLRDPRRLERHAPTAMTRRARRTRACAALGAALGTTLSAALVEATHSDRQKEENEAQERVPFETAAPQ